MTIAVEDRVSHTRTHYLVDNCGGQPLRLPQTFGYRPGAAYVGGGIVLCSGGLGEFEGVWEILEDGTAGRNLGLGRWCADRINSGTQGVALSAYGIVRRESTETRQYLSDGRTRAFAPGTFYKVGGALVVHTPEGEVTLLPPAGADPIVLDLPVPIELVLTSTSQWALLVPPHEVNQLYAYYAVNAETGEWFPTPLTTVEPHEPGLASVRDGLAAILGDYSFHTVQFQRAGGEPIVTDLEDDTRMTVVSDDLVYLRKGDALQLVRVPFDPPGEDEPGYEVVWSRNVAHHESPPDGVGVPWKTVVLDETDGDTWAYPLDGTEPYPFLPAGGAYYGTEYVTALTRRRDLESNPLSLHRNSLGGEFEVLDEGDGLWFQDQPWSPELGRFVYAIRDGDEVSIRQHRLTD